MKYHGNQGGGDGARRTHSKVGGYHQGHRSGKLVMLGRIRATPRGEDDLVRWLDMLGRRQATSRWAEDPVGWIIGVLWYQGR